MIQYPIYSDNFSKDLCQEKDKVESVYSNLHTNEERIQEEIDKRISVLAEDSPHEYDENGDVLHESEGEFLARIGNELVGLYLLRQQASYVAADVSYYKKKLSHD